MRQIAILHHQKLGRQIEACRAACEQATDPAQAEAARQQIVELQEAQRAVLKKLAKLQETETRVLTALRHSTVRYLGLVKRLEARNDYRRLLQKQARAANGGLGFFGTLGAILAINDFQNMADGIDKLAKRK